MVESKMMENAAYFMKAWKKNYRAQGQNMFEFGAQAHDSMEGAAAVPMTIGRSALKSAVSVHKE